MEASVEQRHLLSCTPGRPRAEPHTQLQVESEKYIVPQKCYSSAFGHQRTLWRQSSQQHEDNPLFWRHSGPCSSVTPESPKCFYCFSEVQEMQVCPVILMNYSKFRVNMPGFWLAGRSGVFGEGSYPKPSISVSPGGVIPMGGNVTVRCRHQRLGMRILLYKDGAGNYLTYTDPAGSEAEFPITSARRDHGGSYTCRYSNRSVRAAYSEPSDPVQIIVADPSLPRPSISLSLTSVNASGADATIRCQVQRRDVRFFLHKAGDLNPQRHMDPAVAGAEFRIPSVGRQHRGSYSCSYRPRSEPFVASQPSDTVQLAIAEPSYPKPNISLRPSGQVTLGGAVTIRCECRCRGARVLLSKAGDPDARRSMDAVGDVAEFPIRNVSWGDAGSYSCRYSTKWDPPVWSEPSDPVELVVSEGTDPAGPQQPDPPPMEPEGEGGTDPTQPGKAPAPTRPGTVGPGTGAGGRITIEPALETEGTNPDGTKQTDPSTTESEGEGGSDPTQPGTTPAPTHPGNARPGTESGGRKSPSIPPETGRSESPAPLVQTSTIIAGVSAAAAGLLLLLLVAFVCYRRTQGGKGPAPRQSSGIWPPPPSAAGFPTHFSLPLFRPRLPPPCISSV
ncbi:leukocyte immunoglobulin-like receptor subfamily B member 5 [Mauremys reevesii]|uniref:leukocyte immunoglobulin-like receptor subfamily B member 5 n=1 Tax=Mauremys reevesii TaxID=260615 RepID=UPI00193FAAF3|nr:leukocyte immunoglobulin-like receptor subfamily B member 5 [Mauremys reevesii]